jgi:LmbE family N-acetylglucosaminyl deacetylase
MRGMGLHVYLSPHLDDAVFSCGGLIAQQVSAGDAVTVFTVCAGDSPVGELTPFAYELHRRWGGSGSPMAARRAEDLVACGRLGASVAHYGLVDAIYRRGPDGLALYESEASIFGGLHPADAAHIHEIVAAVQATLPAQAEVYSPLGLGGHIDHRLTRRAAEALGRPLWYYRDLPYGLRDEPLPTDIVLPAQPEARIGLASEEIDAWAAAAGEYHSQVHTFWANFDVMAAELRDYHDDHGGLRIFPPAAVAPAEAA